MAVALLNRQAGNPKHLPTRTPTPQHLPATPGLYSKIRFDTLYCSSRLLAPRSTWGSNPSTSTCRWVGRGFVFEAEAALEGEGPLGNIRQVCQQYLEPWDHSRVGKGVPHLEEKHVLLHHLVQPLCGAIDVVIVALDAPAPSG